MNTTCSTEPIVCERCHELVHFYNFIDGKLYCRECTNYIDNYTNEREYEHRKSDL